jgi:hypothetical protein
LAARWHAREHSGGAEILVNIRPTNAVTITDDLETRALFRRRIGQPP